MDREPKRVFRSGYDYSSPVTSASDPRPLHVLVYSDDHAVRRDVLLALGKRPVPGLPDVTYLEVATKPALIAAADAGGGGRGGPS